VLLQERQTHQSEPLALTLDESLVSPARLGRFLVARRQELDLDVWDIVVRSSRRFTPDDIIDFERGVRQPSEAEAILLKSIYAPDSEGVLPSRMRLVLEMDSRRVRVGEHSKRFGRRAVTKPDLILQRYLKLVYAMRSVRSGTKVPLRSVDIETLATALDLPASDVESTLEQLMVETDWTDQLLTRKVVFPALGVLVASTSFGNLILESDDGTAGSDSLGSVPIDLAINPDREVPTTEASTTETSETIASETVAVEISAVSITRNGDGQGGESHGGATDQSHGHTPGEDQSHGGGQSHLEDQSGDGGQSQTDISAEQVALTESENADHQDVAPGYQELGAEALALIDYDWETILPEWSIEMLPERHGFLGGTYPSDSRIELYVRTDQSPHDLAITLAHEIGHAVDVTLLSDDDRNDWRDLRGIDDRAWFGEAGASDFATPAGDFAEAFAAWQIDGTDFRSELGSTPTSAQTAMLELVSHPDR